MEKDTANQLLKFLQDRSKMTIEVLVNALDEETFPEISASGVDYFVKFKFLKNGKVVVRSKFADVDCVSSKNWIRAIKTTFVSLGIEHKKGKDMDRLQIACSYDERILISRMEYLRLIPYLEMPKRYNISNRISLSEYAGTNLLKNYLTL